MRGQRPARAAQEGWRSRILRSAGACACAAMLGGCALAGNPQPPTLWLPTPVRDLTAVREGNEVHLHWTMPRTTTDKVTLKGKQRAHICWAWANQETAGDVANRCAAAGDAMLTPDKPADFAAQLPTELTAGAPRAVAFFVELQNHAGKTAGPSNAALVAAGPAPPAVTGFGAETRAEGVVLHWDKAAPATGLVLRIRRDLVKGPGAPEPDEAQGAALPEQQTLEVDLAGSDPGRALDRDAPLDHTWRYTAERVLHVKAKHRVLETAGQPSATITIDAKDVFPPRVPQGLAAVADPHAHAIDLSWVPDADADLVGYFVYRRDVTGSEASERVSGAKPLVSPAFSDTRAVPGHRYAYAVSAVDRNGSESGRSEEVEEELPQ